MKQYFYLQIIFALCIVTSCGTKGGRQVMSLNGEWQIAKTAGEIPAEYKSVTPVPGLVDLAIPALDTIVMPKEDTRQSQGYKSGWYWHKRTFNVSDIKYDVIQLKVFKARYHT
ncbi:MAG: hypothetical protein LBR49_05170, partial [Tannerella sp.]|nr:hypothetical protein [Tannerella sp.]